MKLGNVTEEQQAMIRELSRVYWESLSPHEQTFIRGIERSCFITDAQASWLESIFESHLRKEDEYDALSGWEDWD